MKLLIIFMLLSFSVSAQTYLKVADKPEYEEYLKHCNSPIWVDIIQYGKVTIPAQSVPGLDFELAKMRTGTFTDALVKDTFWYAAWKPGMKATAYSIASNQQLVTRIIKVKVPRRIPSVKDFYLNWQTGAIEKPIDWSIGAQ